jgi:hypothetical protein
MRCDACGLDRTITVVWILKDKITRLCRACGGGEEVEREQPITRSRR